VAEEIEKIRAQGRTLAAYDLAVAMQEALDVIEFAKQHKNAMAYFKGVELRSRLSGLLIDKVEVVTVDLVAALQLAEQRVLKQLPAPGNGTSTPSGNGKLESNHTGFGLQLRQQGRAVVSEKNETEIQVNQVGQRGAWVGAASSFLPAHSSCGTSAVNRCRF